MAADLWVQVEVGLPTSKLVDRACAALGIDDDQAIGKLVKLWLAVMEEGCHGQVGERTDRWIERAVDWHGEAGKFAGFVREHHLDENGVIREWLEKYGALEAMRAESARIKRDQRRRIREEQERRAAEEARPPKRPVDSPPDTAVDRPPGGPVDPSNIFNLPFVPALNGQDQQTVGGTAEGWRGASGGPAQLAAFGQQFGLTGKWGDVITGFVRASRDGFAVMCELENHLTGEMGYKKVEYTVLGFALSQYSADGHGKDGRLNSALFAGFVRRGKGRVAANAEDRHIEREQRAAAERDREDQERAAKLNRRAESFEEDHPDRYIELEAEATRQIEAEFKGEVRGKGVLVRGRLIELIRSEVSRAS